MTLLSYCVVNTNGREHLLACLEAIERTHPPDVEHELLVLDNASDDGSARMVRAGWPEVRLIELDRRSRQGRQRLAAAARGARRATACCSTRTPSCRRAARAALLDALEADPRAAAAGAQLLTQRRASRPPAPGGCRTCAGRSPRRVFLHRRRRGREHAARACARSAGCSRARCWCAARPPQAGGLARPRLLRLLGRDRLLQAPARRRLADPVRARRPRDPPRPARRPTRRDAAADRRVPPQPRPLLAQAPHAGSRAWPGALCWTWAYARARAGGAGAARPRPAALPAARAPAAAARARRGDPRGGRARTTRADAPDGRPDTLRAVEHADTAQLAAVGGALGCGARAARAAGALPLLAGLLLLAGAEVALAAGARHRPARQAHLRRRRSAPRRSGWSCSPPRRRCWCAGRRWCRSRVLLAAPFRPPLDFGSSNRFLVSIADRRAAGAPAAALLRARGRRARARLARACAAASCGRCRARSRCRPRPSSPSRCAVAAVGRRTSRPAPNLLVFFTLPFALLLACVARVAVPRLAAARAGARGARAGVAVRARRPRRRPPPTSCSSTRPTSPSRTPTPTTSASRRCSATRASTAATWCSASAWCSRCWSRGRVRRWPLIGLLALLWAGLFFSYSQSSMVALVLVTAGHRRWSPATARSAGPWRPSAAGGAGRGRRLRDGQARRRASRCDDLTSDRTNRVEYTLRVVEHDPVVGRRPRRSGAGQPAAGRQRPPDAADFVSHTTPLTVARRAGR